MHRQITGVAADDHVFRQGIGTCLLKTKRKHPQGGRESAREGFLPAASKQANEINPWCPDHQREPRVFLTWGGKEERAHVNDQQRQNAKVWLTIAGIVVAGLLIFLYLTDRRLTNGQQWALVALTAAPLVIQPIVEQQISKAA